ncbi:MAG: restriction endonuclease subunit S [Fusobacteriaceae bacterium]
MKNKWEQKKLGEVVDIFNGSTPLRSNKEFWENGNFPWFTVEDIREQGRIISYTKQFVTKKALEKLKVLPVDTVLICCTASVGEYAISEIELSCNQQFNGLVIKDKKKLYPKFLFYFASTMKEKLLSVSGKTTIDFIPISRVKEIEIYFPPLDEQKRIVEILDKTFSEISRAKEIAEQNLKSSKEIFESYLQKVFETKGEGWEEKSIEECIKLIDYRGRTPVKTLSGVRLITAKNVKLGYLKTEPQEFIAENNYETWMNRGIPNFGDVIFTTEAPLANVAQIDTNEKLAFAQRIIVMQPDEKKLDQTFLKYSILSNPVRNKILENGSGATVLGIKSSLLKKIKIPFPKSLAEQKSIVKKLDELSAETKKLEKIYKEKLSALDELKKSILQKAFGGEL